jgi:gamma-glutamyl-gamma-aminobutyrate hydrolase PuuD
VVSSASEAHREAPARPRIGVTTYLEQARWGAWDQAAVLLPHLYVAAVHRAGGVPVLLPPLPDGAAEALDGVDGLLVAGGADVDAERYGAEPREGSDPPRRDRDAWELALLDVALDRGVPVLGVCRGAQVLNVATGGSLHQHLPDVVGSELHRPAPAQHGRVQVSVEPGSALAQVVGPEADVPCYHHQAVDRLGEGLRATAWAEDGTVEAVELAGDAFVLGVQWHPELDAHDDRLFAALVQAARRARDGDGPPAGGGHDHETHHQQEDPR